MKAAEKYGRAYFIPPEVTYDWVKKNTIEKAPIWCSVDLRDGTGRKAGIFQDAGGNRL